VHDKVYSPSVYLEVFDMNSARKTLRACLSATVASIALISQAFAAPVTSVSVTPAGAKVSQGAAVTVHVNVTNTDTIIGGTAFELAFDPNLLTFTGLWTDDPNGAMDFTGDDFSDTTGAGVGFLDIVFLSDMNADLSGQPPSFGLVDLFFTASNSNTGTTALTFSDGGLGGEFSDASGLNYWNATTVSNGSVCVDDGSGVCNAPPPVPEPGTLALVGAAALAGLALRRREKRA
jgi:PEP-CTERM motif